MSSLEMPPFPFTSDNSTFNYDEYIQSLKLPPFEPSKIEKIPYETIKINQYKPKASMYSFHTSKERLHLWIKSMTMRYWEQLGKNKQFSINWEEINSEKTHEIQIKVDNDKMTKVDNPRLFLIKIYLKTGTITIQGNGYTVFGEEEFPKLLEFVNACRSKDQNDNLDNKDPIETNIEREEDQDSDTKLKKVINESETELKETVELNTESELQVHVSPSPSKKDETKESISEDQTLDNTNEYFGDKSTDELDPLNTTLIDLDPVSLNKVCNPSPTRKSKQTRSTDIKKLSEKLDKQIELNQNLTSSIQRIEGKICNLYSCRIDIDNIQPIIEIMNQKIIAVETQVKTNSTNDNSEMPQIKIQSLEREKEAKEETIRALQKQLDQKDQTIEKLITEKSKDFDHYNRQLQEKSEEVIEKLHIIHQLELRVKDLEHHKHKPAIIEKEECEKEIGNTSYNVHTQNRFSILQEKEIPTQLESIQKDKKYEDTQTTDNKVDLLIISDSHANYLKEKRLYKYKKVKIHILTEGKKNVNGAKEFILNTTIQSDNVVVIVGSNDLSKARSSAEKIMKEVESLISEFQEKNPNSKLHVSPLFHRLKQEVFNNNVDEINFKLRHLASNKVYILKNPYINKLNEYFFSDGVHFTALGTSELAKMIKNNLNEHLGMESYSNYTTNQGPERSQNRNNGYKGFQDPLNRNNRFKGFQDPLNRNNQYKGSEDPFYSRNPQNNPGLSPNERNVLMRLLNI